ncbi:YscW family type III secretion system pilotin [Pseudomonas fontis]|uniref:YscW family type III secretion system pilotin n=1 Tax=Pseudomonas fontis TaxID=2942633 RepID=A0ABT5P044_9PSED|nr:YscW family type III secretion system pilotin [Pseudomonas fontis]MDD0976405.1 YscW family type III secretion system pilotin [Pseudomonas fontis]MDD0993709.1 YscW family type III secretion system pilotin [Pseudomonas fontis]
MNLILCATSCLLLSGCVAVALEQPVFSGRVDLAPPLTRSGYLTVQRYSAQGADLRLVGEQRYRVNLLPLYFEFSRDVPGAVVVRAQLSWSEGGAVQAQVLDTLQPGKRARLTLKPLPCFPQCTTGKTQAGTL